MLNELKLKDNDNFVVISSLNNNVGLINKINKISILYTLLILNENIFEKNSNYKILNKLKSN